MRVQLLGTGSADGWPNPFCTCASCTWARAHEVRGHTSALVDGALLLDCGPDVPRAAARLGVSLADVRWILLGHAHPDHTGPQALMWRSWSTAREHPLDVIGPPAALDACRPWIGQQDPVTLREIRAGGSLAIGPYQVSAVAAQHGDAAVGPAVLYDVHRTDTGARLLYATDTGPLPPETLEALAGGYDLVLLEDTAGDTPPDPGHLDLAGFATTVATLRRTGAVTDGTRVVAVHLGHGNPTGPVLQQRMAALGAEVLPDGAVVETGPRRSAPARAGRILVTGGTRSGKSAFAEQLLAAEPEVHYVATAAPMPQDAEWEQRIDAHRARRPSHWSTRETGDLAGLLGTAGPPLLVDCLTLWLSREEVWSRPDADAELAAALRTTRRRVVVVTNELGSGVVPASASGRAFRDRLGRLNQLVAAESDEVWLAVAGTPLRLR